MHLERELAEARKEWCAARPRVNVKAFICVATSSYPYEQCSVGCWLCFSIGHSTSAVAGKQMTWRLINGKMSHWSSTVDETRPRISSGERSCRISWPYLRLTRACTRVPFPVARNKSPFFILLFHPWPQGLCVTVQGGIKPDRWKHFWSQSRSHVNSEPFIMFLSCQ